MEICFSKRFLIIFPFLPLFIIAVLIAFVSYNPGYVVPIYALLALFVLSTPLMILILWPKSCVLEGNKLEMRTLLCRADFDVVEFIDSYEQISTNLVIAPIGIRAYPHVLCWGFGRSERIKNGALLFSAKSSTSLWLLVKLRGKNREFYALVRCARFQPS